MERYGEGYVFWCDNVLCIRFIRQYFDYVPKRISLVISTSFSKEAVEVVLEKEDDGGSSYYLWNTPGIRPRDDIRGVRYYRSLEDSMGDIAGRFFKAGHTTVYVTLYDHGEE